MPNQLALRDQYREGLNILPQYMQDSVVAYIEQGRIPGSFLQAVISNDFRGAVTHADQVNRDALRQWAIFFYNFAPPQCHGTRLAMLNWNRRRGLYGLAESAA